MIRLLEIPTFRRWTPVQARSRAQERVTPGCPPASKRQTIAAAYLRAAHAYILISMPTGTSTIFGVFQAILALLVNRTNSALPDKLLRNENFASEIFCHQPRKPRCFYAAAQNEFTDLCGFPVKPMWDQWVQSYPHQS